MNAAPLEDLRKAGSDRRMFRKLVFAFFPPLVGIVVALGVLELGIRIFFSSESPRWEDRPEHYYLPQGAASLTDRDYPAEKEPGVIRIAVVGDSFSFAPFMQYDDAFPKRLERWLNLNSQTPRVEVLNFGRPGYSTMNEVGLVKKALEYHADLVLLQVTLNDAEFKPKNPPGVVSVQVEQLELKGWLQRNWKTLSFVLQRLHNRRSREEYKRYFFDLFDRKRSREAFENALGEIAALSKQYGRPVMAAIFPLFGHVVDESYPFYPIHERIGREFDSLGIPFIDLTESYVNMPLERLQVMPNLDRHPNEIAHRIAAERILEWLRGRNELPRGIFPVFTVDERKGIR